ncbi:MAG: winged helix-turn-helix domain-containing protein [Novosphingobium sp.]
MALVEPWRQPRVSPLAPRAESVQPWRGFVTRVCEGKLRQFHWFSAGPVPAAYDLRRLGWQLLGAERASGSVDAHALLGRPRELPLAQWLRLAGAPTPERKWMMMLEVSDSGERARMLRLGFGDALEFGASLEELEYRVLRLTHFAQSLPRFRRHGALQIDLLARDGFVAGRALGLHPREFALLWRLADTPGESVSPRELLTDVWRLAFRPETNSLAVHVSRLRAKLRLAGIDGMVETVPDGAYRLLPLSQSVDPVRIRNLALDGYLRLGKEADLTAH